MFEQNGCVLCSQLPVKDMGKMIVVKEKCAHRNGVHIVIQQKKNWESNE